MMPDPYLIGAVEEQAICRCFRTGEKSTGKAPVRGKESAQDLPKLKCFLRWVQARENED